MPASDEPPEPCASRSARPARAAYLWLWPSVSQSDVQRLCEKMRGLLTDSAADTVTGSAGALICDVSAVTAPDIGTVEVLVRLQLAALRHGRSLQLRGQCRRLRELLVLTGLCEVLAACREPGAGSQMPSPL